MYAAAPLRLHSSRFALLPQASLINSVQRFGAQESHSRFNAAGEPGIVIG